MTEQEITQAREDLQQLDIEQLRSGADCWSHSPEQMQAYGQACYEKALLDAMNATLPFGKTGRVIAAAIRSLK